MDPSRCSSRLNAAEIHKHPVKPLFAQYAQSYVCCIRSHLLFW